MKPKGIEKLGLNMMNVAPGTAVLRHTGDILSGEPCDTINLCAYAERAWEREKKTGTQRKKSGTQHDESTWWLSLMSLA